ncbi:MAG: ParB/Srx family N-terminal domain-containing protein [Xanthobacteraceae bacterium]
MTLKTDKNVYRRGRPASFSEGIHEQKNQGVRFASNKLEYVPVKKLALYKGNSRVHSRQQIQQIADSITHFGFCAPVLVDDQRQIIAGHGRVEAAKLLGLAAVPTLRLSHLSATEKRAYAIADNRLAEQSGWDRQMLAIELQALIDLDFGVELTGFDLGEVDLILNAGNQDRSGGVEVGDEISERPSRPAISQAGDQWVLGGHRLFCGDAGEPDYAAIDAAIRRWQTLTKKAARLSGTGQTFADVQKKRASAVSPNAGDGSSAAQQEGA